MTQPDHPAADQQPPAGRPPGARRESVIPDNAAFPSLRPLSDTLPSPPQYTRNLPPGQRRLGPEPSFAGPSRVVGFQPISRTISSGGGNAGSTSTSSATATPRSALTSARPPQIKSSRSFGDLDPPRDVHDEFKYLHMGDRKMKMVITRGVGPPVGKFGNDGRGKPRKVKVDEVGGRVEGFVEVGKVDGCVGLDLTITGRSLCTLYYNGQPSLLHSRRLVKHRIDLFGVPPGSSRDKGKGKAKAAEPLIPHYTTFAFGFDFPRYCELEEGEKGRPEDDEDDGDDDASPTEDKYHSVEPSSFGARAIDIAQSSSPAATGNSLRSSIMQRTMSTGSHAEDVFVGSSSSFSPSSWKAWMEGRSPGSSGFGFGKFLKRNSFSAGQAQPSTSAQSPEGDEGRRGFLRRLSTSQSFKPVLDEQYDLPPTTNLVLGDVQAEIEYHIRIRLRRKGLRFNDSLVVNCSYEPRHSVQHLEQVTPPPDAVILPDYPQWQTLPLEGGHQITHQGKQTHHVVPEDGIRAEVVLPSPLLLTLPCPEHQETAHLPTMPFRFCFHSSLPYQYPLLTFASPDTSTWKIRLVRRVTVRIHQKELIRTMPLRTVFKLNDIHTADPSLERNLLEAESALGRIVSRSQVSHQPDPVDSANTMAVEQPSELDAFTGSVVPSVPATSEDPSLATPPPEFAEAYDGPYDPLDPFPPTADTDDVEERIYVSGKLSLCRTAYKSILAPLRTPDIMVEYFLDIEIRPKSGSVKETFEPLKRRLPVLFERL